MALFLELSTVSTHMAYQLSGYSDISCPCTAVGVAEIAASLMAIMVLLTVFFIVLPVREYN